MPLRMRPTKNSAMRWRRYEDERERHRRTGSSITNVEDDRKEEGEDDRKEEGEDDRRKKARMTDGGGQG